VNPRLKENKMNAMKLLDSLNLLEMTTTFLLDGGKITLPKRQRRKMPRGLEYNHGMTAKGKNKGQIGPSRDYKLGW
jgi:hypothetical protein